MKKYYILLLLALCFTLSGLNAQDTIYENINVDTAYAMVMANQGNPDFVILDVRTSGEYTPDHIENAINMDWYISFSTQVDALDKSKTYLLHCAAGTRSGQAFVVMQDLNFKVVYNMLGGINAWKNAGYPTTDAISSTSTFSSSLMKTKIYPNPARNFITLISESNNIQEIEIYNNAGTKQKSIKYEGNPVGISTLAPGIYYLRLNNSSYTEMHKLVIF